MEKNHAKYLYKWLLDFKGMISVKDDNNQALANRDSTEVETINGLLDRWIAEYDAGFLTTDEVLLEQADLETIGSDFLRKYSIYQQLLAPLNFDKEKIKQDSFFALNTEKGRNQSGYETVLIIDEALLKFSSERIWGLKELNQVLNQGKLRLNEVFRGAWGNIKEEDLDSAIWIKPQEYFLTKKIFRAKDHKNIIPENDRTLYGDRTADLKYLLPFKPEILQFFNPKQVRDLNPKFIENKDGTLTFRFDLVIRGRSEPVTIEKKYAAADIVSSKVPVLNIFPNYLGDFWAQYYLMFEDSTQRLKCKAHNYRHANWEVRQKRSESEQADRRVIGADIF
ncbi:MAG: hypothetical protein LRY55_14950 [Leadbetterella sp.]|nr:hypothetical protein [Leadbetterella sp.]